MSTSIHTPEALHSFHISHTECASPENILLKRVVADLQKWLNCSWAAGMIPSCSGAGLVPELLVSCVAGNGWCNQTPDMICPVRNNRSTGLAAIVAIGPKSDGAPYSDEDRHFADALCGHISGLLSNDRLARKVSEDLLTAEESNADIETARGIYERLDHCDPAQFPGLEYGGQCHRAGKLGGDFFDLEARGEDELFVAIGTVAARGMAGGIMLGGALASVRSLARPGESLLLMAREMNRTLWELSPEDSFTSLLCAQINPSRQCLRYINAGHEPALLLRRGSDQVDRLDSTGAVLGLSHRSSYRELTVAFEPGDILAAFTDGIAESTGPRGVVRILREGLSSGVSEMAASVLDAAESGTDRTIVLVRSNEAEACPVPKARYALAAA
jgi:hypothetical protein